MADLPDPRPGPDKDPALVRRMFDRVAPRYDLANSLLSLGQDRHWRRVAARVAAATPGQTVVDVAAGTGALAAELAASGAHVIAADFSVPMLLAGATARPGRLLWCAADALRLPLADGCADALTIAFGLRNLPDLDGGLAEFRRVVRPGGRLVVLEFSTPTWPPFRAVYDRYVARLLPLAARAVSSDPAAYRYLASSIAAWPDQPGLATRMKAGGWQGVRYQNLAGGIVAVHSGVRPGPGTAGC